MLQKGVELAKTIGMCYVYCVFIVMYTLCVYIVFSFCNCNSCVMLGSFAYYHAQNNAGIMRKSYTQRHVLSRSTTSIT